MLRMNGLYGLYVVKYVRRNGDALDNRSIINPRDSVNAGLTIYIAQDQRRILG